MAARLTRQQSLILAPKINSIYAQAQEMFAAIERAKQSAVVVSTLGKEKLISLDSLRQQFQGVLFRLKTFVDTGLIDGLPPTPEDLSETLGRLASVSADYEKVVRDWNDMFLSNKINKALGEGIESAMRISASLRSSIESLVTGGATWVSYIPLMLAIVFLGPPLLRIISGVRKGGAEGFLDVSQRELEAANQAARSAASQTAAFAAKAGAAYASGGATLAVPGMGVQGYSRRYRRR